MGFFVWFIIIIFNVFLICKVFNDEVVVVKKYGFYELYVKDFVKVDE